MQPIRSLLLAVAAVVLAETAAAGSFTLSGRVGHVADGDTIDVALDGGRTVTVRVLGVDAPEAGDCYSSQASRLTASLALDKRVLLKGDGSQATHDQYGRMLAYVWLPGGHDLGYRLLVNGAARVDAPEGPFERLGPYRSAESIARRRRRGLWACAPSKGCNPAYSPCLPIVKDLDCSEIPASKKPVHVLRRGDDPYKLDSDGDGIACERTG